MGGWNSAILPFSANGETFNSGGVPGLIHLPATAPGIGILADLIWLALRSFAVRRSDIRLDDIAGITKIHFGHGVGMGGFHTIGNP